MTIERTTGGHPEDATFAPRRRGPGPRLRAERDIVAEVLTHLRGLPQAYARKVHGGAMGNVGEPDIDACVRGRSVKLEAKRAGNRPTRAQVAALRRWAQAGALVGWFRELGHVTDLLEHCEESGFVPDLARAGCVCDRHRGRSAG